MTDPVPSKDLVSRLRDPHEADGYGDDMVIRREAADEIERLRLQVYALTNANKSLAEPPPCSAQPPGDGPDTQAFDAMFDAEFAPPADRGGQS